MENEYDIPQLIRMMDEAVCEGQLRTVQRIINLEKEECADYTRCEETMNELRTSFKRNAERIANQPIEGKRLNGEATDSMSAKNASR